MHSNSIEEFEWWVLTVTLPTGPEVFAGLGGWAYGWTKLKARTFVSNNTRITPRVSRVKRDTMVCRAILESNPILH